MPTFGDQKGHGLGTNPFRVGCRSKKYWFPQILRLKKKYPQILRFRSCKWFKFLGYTNLQLGSSVVFGGNTSLPNNENRESPYCLF